MDRPFIRLFSFLDSWLLLLMLVKCPFILLLTSANFVGVYSSDYDGGIGGSSVYEWERGNGGLRREEAVSPQYPKPITFCVFSMLYLLIVSAVSRSEKEGDSQFGFARRMTKASRRGVKIIMINF